MTNKFRWAKELIGGTSDSLDNFDGSLLTDGDGALVKTAVRVYFYNLNATSGKPESSPYVIEPDSNAGTKRWELLFSGGGLILTSTTTSTTSTTSSSTTTTTAP